jgi:hypothetical protein
MLVDLVNIHLATKHDQAADVLQLGPSHIGPEGIEAREWDPGLGEHRRRNPEGVTTVISNTNHRPH